MKNKNAGFGLVEIMIAAGLMAGLAVVLLSLNKQSATTLVKSKVDQEGLLIVNEVVAILSNPANCAASLGGRNANSTPAGPITRIVHNGTTKFAVGTSVGDAQLKVKSYSLSAAGPDVSLASNTTHLQINFERKILQSGSGDITKKIRLYVEVDGANNIVNCRSLSSSSTDIWSRGNNGDIYYSGGNVGVGTTTPRSSLEVNGGVRAKKGGATSADSSNEGFSFENDGDSGIFSEGGTDTMGSTLTLKADGGNGLKIKNSMYYGTPDCFEVSGPATFNGSYAGCPAGTVLQSGGGNCTDGIHAYIHQSQPSGNGWVVDCYRHDGNGDADAVAVARCCRVTPP